jgi:hypothetical protein
MRQAQEWWWAGASSTRHDRSSHPSDALDEGCGRRRAQSAPFVDHVRAGIDVDLTEEHQYVSMKTSRCASPIPVWLARSGRAGLDAVA